MAEQSANLSVGSAQAASAFPIPHGNRRGGTRKAIRLHGDKIVLEVHDSVGKQDGEVAFSGSNDDGCVSAHTCQSSLGAIHSVLCGGAAVGCGATGVDECECVVACSGISRCSGSRALCCDCQPSACHPGCGQRTALSLGV